MNAPSPPRALAGETREQLDQYQDGRTHDHEQGTDGERNVETELEVLIDQQRQRLRNCAQVAGKHDGGAELADAARECQGGARGEAGRGERDAHAHEQA